MRRWDQWGRRHWRALTAFASVSVLALAFGLFWLQPWKLFTDTTVNEALPAAAVPSAAAPATAPVSESESESALPTTAAAIPVDRLLAQGELISHEHATHGTVSVVARPDGRRVLALANLSTSNGPDLRVWLASAPVEPGRDGWHVFDDPQYQHLSLGALKGNRGNQVYEIPAGADLGALTSVTIWCDRFNVSFGAAALTGTTSGP
jgi:hypothetical protein